MTDIICDFCSSPDVRWSFAARSFTTHKDFIGTRTMRDGTADIKAVGITFGSDGNWAACPACHALIASGERYKLARRSAKRFLKAHPIPMSLSNATDMMRTLHDEFWSNREGGEPTRVEP
jgi:hypothetical protein